MPKDPAALGSIPSVPEKISEEKIIDVAEVNQRPSIEESTQWLENVDGTHLVLASGKLVLQKITCIHKFLPKSYEKFLIVLTKKFYKDFVQADKDSKYK